MRTHLVFVFAALCAAAPAVSAQSIIGAEIPFAFTVGNNEYPAGAWTFERSASTAGLYTLRDQSGKSVAMVMTTGLGGDDQFGPPRLVFHRYGTEYYLAEIWRSPGSGAKLKAGSVEKRLLASGQRPEKTVFVLARK